MSEARAARRTAAAFGVAAFFSDVAHETVSAVLPAFLLLLGGTPRSLGYVEGCADAAAALCKLYAGRFADRRRTLKPATTFGYAVSAAALPLVGLATSWLHVILLRTVALSGRGFRSPLRDQLLARAVPPSRRGAAFGLERAMDQAGGLLASVGIAALLAHGVGVRSILIATVVPGVLATLAIVLLVSEKPAVVLPPVAVGGPWPPAFRRFLVSIGVYGLGDFPVNLAILWAVGGVGALGAGAAGDAGGVVAAAGGAGDGVGSGDLSRLASQAALLYASYKLVAAPTAYFAGRCSDRYGRRGVYVAGHLAGFLGACVPCFVAPSFGAGLVVTAASGLLYGVQESVQKAWGADLAPVDRRGRAFGAIHALRGLTSLGAGVLVAELWSAFGAVVAFAASALLMASGLVLAAGVRSPIAR